MTALYYHCLPEEKYLCFSGRCDLPLVFTHIKKLLGMQGDKTKGSKTKTELREWLKWYRACLPNARPWVQTPLLQKPKTTTKTKNEARTKTETNPHEIQILELPNIESLTTVTTRSRK